MSNITQEQQDIINDELKKFVSTLMVNPNLKGVAIQLAYHKPEQADSHVSSLFIGSSANDTKLAVGQLKVDASTSMLNVFSDEEKS